MKLRSQKEKAEVLLSLHTNGKLLVLPNVWNPIGARILEKKGFPAVATASAAISASLGYQDGEKIKRATAIDLIGRIARIVDVPVTADIETGYAESLSELEVTAQQVVESGAVGVNIEDGLEWEGGLRAIEDQCQRISAFRKFAERSKSRFVSCGGKRRASSLERRIAGFLHFRSRLRCVPPIQDRQPQQGARFRDA